MIKITTITQSAVHVSDVPRGATVIAKKDGKIRGIICTDQYSRLVTKNGSLWPRNTMREAIEMAIQAGYECFIED